MSHDVFISHSAKDKSVADAIVATLEGRRVRCWVAPRDIRPGQNWGESIINAIESSRLMVVVFSGASNNSHQVVREVERAVSKGLAIIPLRIEDVTPSKSMEYFLSTPHWLDALTPPVEAHIERLAEVVCAVLEPPRVLEPGSRPATPADQTPRASPRAHSSTAAPSTTSPAYEQANAGKSPVAEPEPRSGLAVLNGGRAAAAPSASATYPAASGGAAASIAPSRSEASSATPPGSAAPAPGAPQPISAARLRAISDARLKAHGLWQPLKGIEAEPGLGEMKERAETLARALDEAFVSDRFEQAQQCAVQLAALCSDIRQAKTRRDAAEKLREKARAAEVEARAIDVPRLAIAKWTNAERFLKQANETYRAGQFDHARDHWREADRELQAALSAARPLRREELRKFVLRLAHVLRTTALRSDETRRQATDLARECSLSAEQAKPLAKVALALSRDPSLNPLPDEAVNAALGPPGQGLGPSSVQRSVVVTGARRSWPLVVLIVYLVVLGGLVAVTGTSALFESTLTGAVSIALAANFLALLSAGLLLLPVRVATRRPVARGSLWATLVASGALAGGLALCLLIIFDEVILHDALRSYEWKEASKLFVGFLSFGLVVLAWPLWMLLFWLATRSWHPFLAAEHVTTWLVRGTILELLVAVPCHLWMRRRDSCSVGMGTGAAIVMGLVIALIAIGPGLVILYAERAGRLQLPDGLGGSRRRTLTPVWIAAGAMAILGALLALFGPGGVTGLVLMGMFVTVTATAVIIACTVFDARAGKT